MPKPKIDVVKLNQMLRSGKSVKQCAEYFKVTPAAVSMAKKNLNVSVVKNVALENAHRVINKNLNIIDQLNYVNEATIKIMDELVGKNQAIDRIAKAVETILQHKDEPKKQRTYIKKIILQLSQDKKLALEAGDRVLNQLKFQKEIFKDMYDIKEVAEFQREVLSAIAEVSPEVRNQIVNNLKEKRALRSSVTIKQ